MQTSRVHLKEYDFTARWRFAPDHTPFCIIGDDVPIGVADVTRGDEILSQGKQVEVFGLFGGTVIHTYTAILGNRLNTSSFISQHPSQTTVVDGH